MEHELGGIHILGYSVAGEESVVALPQLDACFDVGKAPSEVLPINHVLLTHGHMDHAAGLAYYFSQREFVGIAPGCSLMPERLVQPVRDLLRAWAKIEGHEAPARLIGMRAGDEHELRRGLVARAFDINHGVPALGFVLIDVRHKLKPEFVGKTGNELVELKKQGIEIEYRLEVPLIAYCGDTAEGRWIENDAVRRAKVIVIECTFYDADHVQRARAGHHMHVRDMARILPRLENEHVLLTHVTRRTFLKEARRSLTRLVGDEAMGRVKFLMEGKRPRPGPAIPIAPNGPKSHPRAE